jgi:predicted unusual protein kinase regulating ubiquinone biosynthesis (AarF/ABC1/UbiB family)
MKGLALKAGQMMATSADLVPDEYRPVFRRVLGRLYDRATFLPFAKAKGVVEADLGRPLEQVFRAFDEQPLAAASIGQVHEAVLVSGERVAVKVQYPEVAQAIAGDLSNLELVKRVIAPLFRADWDRTFEDIRARITDECDYRLEAKRLERFGELWKGDAEIRVPRVHAAHSGARVLTMELASGLRLAEMSARSPAERSKAGAALYRFVYSSLLEHGLLYADPHPGNFLFRPDEGTVWVLDMGCVQELEREFLELTFRMHRAAMDGNPEIIHDTFNEALQAETTEEELELLDRFLVDYVYRPFAKDAEFEFTEPYVREIVEWTLSGTKVALRNIVGRGNIEAGRKGVVWLNRILVGLNNILAALGAKANFHRIHAAILDRAERRDAQGFDKKS